MAIEEDKTFYTMTMARVHADQGRFDAAARIYRYLLDQTPDRADLRHSLDAVSAMLPETSGQWKDVAGLIDRWVQLVLRQNELRRLRQIRIRKTGAGG